jgi:2-oxoglutarate ferredoxin oxidoreductase subunit alpha
MSVSQIHLRHLHPFPSNLGDVLRSFDKVLLPELTDGHLALLLRAKYLVDVQSFSKIIGQPFKIGELVEAIRKLHGA